jgi:HlyD family secretion protein
MKRLWIIALLLVLLAVGGYLAYQQFRPQSRNTALVRRGSISASVETTGRVRPARQARLAAQATGVVQEVLVTPGAQVAKGDVLLHMSSPSLERAVKQAELSLEIQEQQLLKAKSGGSDEAIAIASARLRQATVILQAAQSAYDKIAGQKDAAASDAATSDQAIALQGARVNYEIAKSDFERAAHGATSDEITLLTKQRDIARLALEGAQEQREQANLRAPFAGTVLEVNAQASELIFAGNVAATLADLGNLEIAAQIDEIDIAEVAVGQRVEITLDAFPDKRLVGSLKRLNPAATPQRGSTVYEAAITFDAAGLPLRPDMGANLTIITLDKPDVLLVPSRAVVSAGQKRLVRVLEGRQIRELEVVLGLTNRQEVEILSGLREGQIILVE